MNLLSPLSTSLANFAGIHSFCNFSSFSRDSNWVNDTGASNHISPNSSALIDSHPLNNSCPIQLSTGDTISVTQLGIVHLSPYLSLHNVLHVPSFQFNQISLSKIIATLNCVVFFFPPFVFFRTRKLIGLGEVRDCLYYFKPFSSMTLHSHSLPTSTLWHQFPLHPSHSCFPKTLSTSPFNSTCNPSVRVKHTRFLFSKIIIKVHFFIAFIVIYLVVIPLLPIRVLTIFHHSR